MSTGRTNATLRPCLAPSFASRATRDHPETSSAHREAAQPFGFLVDDVDVVHLGATWSFVREANEPVHRFVVTLENGFDRAVPAVGDPTGDTVLLCEPSCRITEEDTLHSPVHDDAAADHEPYSPRPMEFRDILERRRMVRAYTSQPVSRETLERIVGTIRRAPSAGYSQGQRFVVVTEPDGKRALADAAGEEFYVEQGFDRWISGAAAIVVVCTREDDYHDRYRQPDKLDEAGAEIEWPVPYWHVDAGKAAMLVILAAIDEGLATGVFGFPADRVAEIRELLRVPGDVTPVEAITLGHAGNDNASDRLSSRGTRPRKALDELVHWDSW
jgi:nitroreductase